MTSQFHPSSNSKQNLNSSFAEGADKFDDFYCETEDSLLLCEDLDDTEAEERFILLSSYLDGEATSEECRQVEAWLASDPQMRQFYNRVVGLRQGLKSFPVPQAPQPIEPLTESVFERIDRQNQRRWMWGSGAIAALFVAAVSGFSFSGRPYMTQLARISIEPENASSAIAPVLDAQRPEAVLVDSESPSPLLSKALFVE
ncbi:MAG: hypothetical protein SWY16_01620 [Cyanobacteriota bacterium]|nr:hypothetical protein [Cyanobacteriota bacterium]